jgi:rhodanese-related sulfurtransferase
MNRTELVLSSSLALAIAACAPSDGGKDQSAPGLPSGFELAAAQESSATASARDTQGEMSVAGLTNEELELFMESGHLRLIDVRTAEEVAEGMIPGAQHIPLDEFDPANLDPRTVQDVVLYCRSGRRSAIAAEKLAAFTGEPAKHLADGIIGWKEAGLETVLPAE